MNKIKSFHEAVMTEMPVIYITIVMILITLVLNGMFLTVLSALSIDPVIWYNTVPLIDWMFLTVFVAIILMFSIMFFVTINGFWESSIKLKNTLVRCVTCEKD